MQIGVISDTHAHQPTRKLQTLAAGIFKDMSLILHAGDLTQIAILDAFLGKQVIAVCGNMDSYDVTRALPSSRIVSVEGHHIGLTHGWGFYSGIEKRVMALFQDVQAIVYGHSHQPANHLRNGVLLFNPGSFSGSRVDGRSTVGILTVEKRKGISGEIVTV
jgi:putative phosphoesterase